MKAILTITSGNKDSKNFTRDLEVTPDEYEYLKRCERFINQGDNHFIGVHLYQL